MRGVDFVFHAAALKQVPSCEFHPMQAVETNVIGTENVLNIAINAKVKKMIVLSTDKAVYPINAMMERVAVAKSRNIPDKDSMYQIWKCDGKSWFCDTTFFRGETSNYYRSKYDDAVELVLFAFKNGKTGDIFVQKAPAATVGLLAKTLKNMVGKLEHEIRVIGTRHSEKLLTREEMVHAIDMGEYYRIPADTRDLNYDKFFSDGQEVVNIIHTIQNN